MGRVRRIFEGLYLRQKLREIRKHYYERRSCVVTSKKVIEIVGLVATVVGLGANLVSSWVSDKKMEAEIEAKVIEKINELNK